MASVPPAPQVVPAVPEALPPLPPILLEGDPVPPMLKSGPGGRFAAPAGAAAEPAVRAESAPVVEPEWEEMGDHAVGRLWLVARDPFTLHATWDLTPEQVARAGAALALRLYVGRQPGGPFREVAAGPREWSAFIPVELPGQWYVAEIGFSPAAGAWETFAVSLPVQTPAVRAPEPAPAEFVMLTLPPELAAEGRPEPLAASPAAAGRLPAEPVREPLPPQPAPKPEPLIAPAAGGAAAKETVPLPVPLPEPTQPAPLAPPLPVEATAPSLPAVPPGPAPSGPGETGAVFGRGAEVLQRVAAPTWRAAQAQAMAAELAAPGRGAPPGSLTVPAAGPGPAGPAAGAVPPIPASGEWPPGPERLPQAPLPSSAEGGLPAPRPRRFWFNIHAELIVYGATEPDARVTVDGESIPLRPDGSFTLRFALPDGEYALRAEATAADGAESRTACLNFVRHTTYRGPVESAPADPALRPPAARSASD